MTIHKNMKKNKLTLNRQAKRKQALLESNLPVIRIINFSRSPGFYSGLFYVSHYKFLTLLPRNKSNDLLKFNPRR